MRTDHLKVAIIVGWVVGLGTLALAVNLDSIFAWTVLVGIGLLPPLVMLKTWNPPAPAQTMSESIREAIK